MEITFFYLLILYACTNVLNISGYEIYPFLTYSYFYPSFQQLDVVFDPISSKMVSCPEKCIECKINSTNLFCTKCEYGTIFYNNLCVECPENCLDCFDSPLDWKKMFEILRSPAFILKDIIRNERKLCLDSEILQYYYYADKKYEKCSDYCLSCENKFKCLECQTGYFLKFNNLNNYSCSKCSEFSDCSTCIIANTTQKIDSSYFHSIDSLENFISYKLKYNWDIICLTCPSKYFRKTDSKCYKCADEIPDCLDCTFISHNQSIEAFGENVIFQNFQAHFFVLCLNCDVESNKFLQIEKSKDVLSSKCLACGFLFPLCNKCALNISFEEKPIEDLGQILSYNTSQIFEIKFRIECRECEEKFYLISENFNYTCISCPNNCEYCYLNPTIICGRCEENYVLNFFEGQCYPIREFNNITEEYLNSCSRIISDNPFANFFFDSSFFLCQKCRNSTYYPSLNGNCMTCLDTNCEVCGEFGKSETFDTISYTDLLYKSPYLLLGNLTQFTFVSMIQKCIKCNCMEKNAYNPIYQTCCPPTSYIYSTEENVRILIAGCLNCSSCEMVDSKFEYFGCTKCSKCEDILLNDEVNILTASYLTSFYGKTIYYQLMNEGDKFNATPPFNETDTYRDIYNSLTSQKQVDLVGKSIYKCTPCPINSIDCKVSNDVSRIPDPNIFLVDSIEFYDLMSYYLVSTKCRNNFVYDYSSSRCKFCPNKWRNCKAYKIIEINFIGQSKLFNDTSMVNSLSVLILYLKNIEFSEFAFICNEFLVKEIEIHILIDIDEVIIWESIYEYSMVIESSLKSRILSLEKYELIFIPKHYDVNTYATIKLGSYITFKGYTSVKFINIKFKPFDSINEVTNVPNLKLTPSIEINAESIFLTRCSLIFDQFNSNDGILDSTISPLHISFLLISDNLNIENFEIKNLILKNFDATKLLNMYRLFEIQSKQVNLKNLTFENLIIYNVFSVFHFPSFEGFSQLKIENIYIRNCEFSESIFLRIGSSLSLNLTYFYIFNTTFAEKPIVTSLLEIIKGISISDFLIEKSNFFGRMNVNYLFSLNLFNDVKNFLIIDSYFFRTIIFFCIERTILQDNTFNFHNIFCLQNVLENFEGKFPFLMFFKFSEYVGLALNIQNITLENNLMILKKKVYSFAAIFINVDSIISKNWSFVNNANASAINIENCNSIEYYKFICAKNTSKIDQTQDQLAMRILNAENSIKLENFYLDSIFSQQGVIIISQEMKYEASLCRLFFKNSIFNNIFIRGLSFGSAFFIDSLIAFEINIIQVKFSNLLLNDESEYQKASSAIYIDSSFSSCKIEKSVFFNGVSNGESNFIRIFVSNLTISESNMSLANYFNESESVFSTKIINQGSFINAFIINLVINSSQFSKAYSLNGGAVYSNFLNKEGSIKINNCSFHDLYSFLEGGALYISKNNDKNHVVIVTDCTFRHVFALSNGGVFIIKTLALAQIFIINSFFSNINSAAGSLILGSNFNLKMLFVNISENYNIFSDKSFDFFSRFKGLQFSTLMQMGSIISLRFGLLHFNSCNFYNLSSSTLDNEGTILNCQNCEFYDYGSFYENIYFWKYAFSLSDAIVFIKKSTFRNVSAYSFSNTILIDGIFLKVNQKLYYPVFILTNSQFNLIEVTGENIECLNCVDGGGFLLAFNSIINILLSNFQSNDCVFGFLCSIDSSVIINSSFFENNRALQYGGSLSLKKCNAFIFNSSFVNGTARKGEGGAIYFYSESNKNFSIISCYFENNIASIGGAIFYQKIAIFIDSLTIFKNNKALLYGDNLYSFPFSLCFLALNKCEKAVPYIKSFRSGASLNYLYVKLLDENGNMIIQDDFSNPIVSMKLVVLNSSLSANDSLYTMNYTNKKDLQMNQEGTFVVDNLLLIGKPETDIEIQFSSPQIMYNASLTGFKVIRNYSISLYIHFRKCEVGEYYQEITSTCFLCLEGTYSYNPLVEGCNDCPPGLNCSGGAETIVFPNFWRSNRFSEKIVYCSMNPVNCLGGKESKDNLCLNGHIGAKCESCDLTGRFWNSSFSRTPNYGCTKCDHLAYNYAILAFLSLFNFLSMALSIKGTISNINTRLKFKVIKRLARYGMFDNIKINESSIYLKIYFSYLQIIQVVTTMNLSYSSWVNIPGSTFGAPTNSVLYSLDCLISHIIISIPYVHVKLIIALLVPFLYLIIFVFGYMLFMRKSKFHHKYSMLYTVCLFTLLYFQPNIVDNIISVLSCIQVGDKKYIKADVAYECTGEEYDFYSIIIGIPSLFFWGVGTPLSILFRLVKERKHLQNITNQIRYGYIYDEYDIFYWEFVRMYEKILIVIILSFFESEILIKGLMVLFIIFTYSLLLFKNNPYKSKKLNRTDKINSIVCYLSIFLGMLAYSNPYDIMIAIIFSLMLAINAFFNFFMLKNIFSSMAFALLRRLRKYGIIKYFVHFKKKKDTKWLTVRRLVGKYLREKERVKLMRLRRIKKEEEKYKLSIIDYNPNKLITKQKEAGDFKEQNKSNNSSFREDFSELANSRGDVKMFISNKSIKK